MARSSIRAHGPTESQRVKARLGVALALVPALAGCVSYEPAPVDVSDVLTQLRARAWESSLDNDRAQSEGAGPDQLAAFGITHNPSLQAVRSQIGVARALLVEAGLLPDPEIGWDAMNVLASALIGDSPSSHDYLSGLGLSITLPRPGELDSKKGAARWRVEEIRRLVTQAEWVLAREVFVSFEDVREAQRLVEQNQDLIEVAESTRDYFDRAQAAGAATAIQANLASGDLLAIQADRVRLQARLRDARHRLNALLGLPPSTEIPLTSPEDRETPEEPGIDPEALVERSLELRPDLIALQASYQAAEEDVRLEVARQFPLVSIGTGIWFQPGFFTRFNRPAIDTAIARRETLRSEIEAQVHEVRRDIQDAYAALGETRRELDLLESRLLPNAEESLRLAGEAFDAGEVTLVEILTLQRALVDARTRTTVARAELRRRHWRLLAAGGTLLARGDEQAHRDDEQETER